MRPPSQPDSQGASYAGRNLRPQVAAGRNSPARPTPQKTSPDLLLPTRPAIRAAVLYAGGLANAEIAQVWGISKGRVVHAFLPWSLKTVALYRYDRQRYYRLLDELDATLFVDSDGHVVKLPADRRGS